MSRHLQVLHALLSIPFVSYVAGCDPISTRTSQGTVGEPDSAGNQTLDAAVDAELADAGPDALDASRDPDANSDAAVCVEGTRRCNGLDAEECQDGVYRVLFSCPATQSCLDAACVLTPPPPGPCDTRECGPNGAGGLCGVCGPGERCDDAGQCVTDCIPECDGRECGSNGCGGTCGACPAGTTCSEARQCEPLACIPQCAGRECGGDGCGGACGACGDNENCVSGQCVWDGCGCGNRVCGVDPCGNSCGTCGDGEACVAGACEVVVLSCVELIDCVYGAEGCASEPTEEAFQSCADGCYATSTEASVAELESYVGCLAQCPERDGDPATTEDDLQSDRCIYSNCSDEQASCVFEVAGTGTCFGIMDCWDTCAQGDEACSLACYDTGTAAAQVALVGLVNCAAVECPDGSADACIDEALVGRCAIFAEMCLNN
jgi:hypothetical protein